MRCCNRKSLKWVILRKTGRIENESIWYGNIYWFANGNCKYRTRSSFDGRGAQYGTFSHSWTGFGVIGTDLWFSEKGDIALFKRQDGQYILHRIYKIKQDGYYFVGDNQNICDIEGPIRREQICAVVYKARRHGIEIQEKDFIWRLFRREWRWAIRWRRQIKRWKLPW